MSSSSSSSFPAVLTCKGNISPFFFPSILPSSASYPIFSLFNEAAVAWGPGQPLVIEEVEVSPPQPMEIRIKVVSTSLCRSDLSAWETQVLASSILS